MYHFLYSVISNCIQLLVQDLETACEPALTAMSKVNFSTLVFMQNFKLHEVHISFSKSLSIVA